MRINRRKMKFYKRKINYILSFTILLMLFTLGYAFLNTDIRINGTGYINKAEWDVHLENIQTKTGSVTPTTSPTITNDTTVSFEVDLEEPGDFYEFNIDVVNDGTIPAMIGGFTVSPTLTTAQANYFEYSVTYSDGIAIAQNHLLDVNTTETLKISFTYKELVDTSLYPTADQNFQFSVTLNYVQADDTAITVAHPISFADDSWDTIISAAQSGNTSAYTVGSTKTVDLGTLGTHTLRIANTSTPSECGAEGFSQTACGFVLEFADIITEHQMNQYYQSGSVNGDGNKGGWEYSEARTYINSDIYNALPTALKNAIINTTVVSGHGKNDTTNFTTTDKLYLLSTHEVWEDADGNTSGGIDYYDTAYNNTRQLDYYANLNVTTSSYSGAIKQDNGLNYCWWLRSAGLGNNRSFWSVGNTGSSDGEQSSYPCGLAPAFRLG